MNLRFRQGRVRSIERLGGDISLVAIEPADGLPLPAWGAGAHIELEVSRDIIRPYSLCGRPGSTESYRIGVLRDPASRGGSETICEQWATGRRIRFCEPRNLFPLSETSSRAILVGAGVGITPLIAMAYALADADTPFELHYCARNRVRAGFLAELERNLPTATLRTHFSEKRRFDMSVDVGMPTSGADLYVCGPQGFIDQVLGSAEALGWPSERLHREYFDIATDVAGGPFEVVLDDGQRVAIPEGASIAQVLIEHGYEIEMSCEKGICGSCITTVTGGIPDHRDHYLTDEEKARNDCIALCCSRALTPDLRLALHV